MNIIKLKPYVPIKNKDYATDTKIIIDRASFQNTTYQLGTSEFFFSDCRFVSLEIENDEEIAFKDINIHFSNCYIRKIRINSFLTPNFSLFFGNCILDANINSKNIKSVIINNCLLDGAVVLTNIKNASILYTEENVFPIKWRRLFKSVNTDFQSVVKENQNYLINSVENLTFSLNEQPNEKRGVVKKPYAQSKEIKYGYYLEEAEKKLLFLNLNVQYEADKEHKSTKVINAKLSSLSLQGYSKGKIEIENCKIDDIHLST